MYAEFSHFHVKCEYGHRDTILSDQRKPFSFGYSSHNYHLSTPHRSIFFWMIIISFHCFLYTFFFSVTFFSNIFPPYSRGILFLVLDSLECFRRRTLNELKSINEQIKKKIPPTSTYIYKCMDERVKKKIRNSSGCPSLCLLI